MKNNDELKVVIMSYDYDYLDTAPTGAYELGIYFRDYHASRAAKIDYTTLDFSAVNGGNVSKINGVAVANISKVNSV